MKFKDFGKLCQTLHLLIENQGLYWIYMNMGQSILAFQLIRLNYLLIA